MYFFSLALHPLTECGFKVAAAEAIFGRPELAENVTTLEFQTLSGILTAHRVGNQISMELPAGTTVSASPEETGAVQDIFARALSKPSVDIRYIGYGGPGFLNYLLVEVDKGEKLSEWRPNIDCFVRIYLPESDFMLNSCPRPNSHPARKFWSLLRLRRQRGSRMKHACLGPLSVSRRTMFVAPPTA
jgi:hypothetical protein